MVRPVTMRLPTCKEKLTSINPFPHTNNLQQTLLKISRQKSGKSLEMEVHVWILKKSVRKPLVKYSHPIRRKTGIEQD